MVRPTRAPVEEITVQVRVDAPATVSTQTAANSTTLRPAFRDGRDELRDAHPRIRHVAALCELAAHRTGGAFSAWLPGPGGRPIFDPTGLVKGWAVEQAVTGLSEQLVRLGRYDILANAGGDIAVHCRRTDTPDWAIGIEDPRDRSRILRTVHLRTGAAATSGTAARGHHITDPATGSPATGLLSATVIGPELTWADIYATAAFVKGRNAAAWIATLDDHAGLLVEPSGRVTTCRGLARVQEKGLEPLSTVPSPLEKSVDISL